MHYQKKTVFFDLHTMQRIERPLTGY